MKTIIMILLPLLMLGTQAKAQKQSTYTKGEVKTELIKSFADFVESVKPFYSKGDSYLDFKLKVLIGNPQADKSLLPTLPAEGEALLLKAYNYLKAGYSYTEIINKGDFETMGKAAIFMSDKVKSGKTETYAEIALFGGNSTALETNPMLPTSKKPCKWYQLWCHLDNVLGEGWGETIIIMIIEIIFP